MTAAEVSTNELNIEVVEPTVKSIIKTVLERCERECELKSLAVPLEAYEQRASYYTALPVYCFFELSEVNKQLPLQTKYNVRQKLSILNSFKTLYAEVKLIKYTQVFEIFTKNSLMKPSDPPLYVKRELNNMGYQYRNSQKGWTIVENPELRYERFNFLNKIIKMRNKNRQICYIEARVIDKSLEFPKISSLDFQQHETDKYYFLHAISREGYINGLFCNEIDTEIFTKWVTDILVTVLPPEAVLVIDSGEVFNENNKIITRYSTKQEMLQWLRSNNIPCTAAMYKPELYDLIMQSGIKDCEYKIDHILKAHGHVVLRLPKNFNDLTPTELLWKHMKTEKYNESLIMVGLKNSVESHISKIEQLKWELFSDAVANWEKEIFDIDAHVEQLLELYKFDNNNFDLGTTSIPEHFFDEKDNSQINLVNSSHN